MLRKHSPQTIYFDYQATTPVDPRVFQAMLPYFCEEYGNPHSSDHILGWRAASIVDQAREEIATAIGADNDEIIFTSGATESNNLALLGLFRKIGTSGKKRILISAIEHKCIMEIASILERDHGAIIETIPVDNQGVVDVDYIESRLNRLEDVAIVSVMAVNNEIGTIEPIAEIGKLTRSHQAYFHCDAAQALSAIDIDTYESNIDLLSLSAHKVYGPKGIGALFVRRELVNLIEPVIYGGGQQNGLRSGTLPVPLCFGFAEAVKLLRPEYSVNERNELLRKRNRLIDGIKQTGIIFGVNGPQDGLRHPGNANVSFPGFYNHDILAALQPHLAASTGSACTSGTPEPSYVLRAIGLTNDEAETSIRFSVGRFTTDQEIDTAVNIISEVLERIKK